MHTLTHTHTYTHTHSHTHSHTSSPHKLTLAYMENGGAITRKFY